MPAPTPAEVKALNQAFFDRIDGGEIKIAADASSEYTRMFMREESVTDKVLPGQLIGNDMLDRQVDTDKPVRIEDREPTSPAAVSVPFGQLPFARYITAPRYRVLFARIHSTRHTKDVDELRTYNMDVRQVLSDNSIKDMAAEKDGKFFGVCDILVGTLGYATIAADETGAGTSLGAPTNLNSGKFRNYILQDANGITRETLVEMLKAQPAQSSRIETQTVVCNNLTIKDILKFGRDEMGGDFSEEVLLNGWSERTFLNVRWIITIKRDLVANNVFYNFVEPKFLGKHYLLEDTTMWMRKEAFMLEWFCYQNVGLTIANLNGVVKVKISRSGT
jgi:hypothetical protein